MPNWGTPLVYLDVRVCTCTYATGCSFTAPGRPQYAPHHQLFDVPVFPSTTPPSDRISLRCINCENAPTGGNSSAAAAAAVAAGPSMSLPLNAQHQAAMLLAMQQQQQQQADFDPAAMARLQLFGGAGYPEVRQTAKTEHASPGPPPFWLPCDCLCACLNAVRPWPTYESPPPLETLHNPAQLCAWCTNWYNGCGQCSTPSGGSDVSLDACLSAGP